ncbi:MAG: helix-turn-helix domain-containing protein [Candidatus Eiseniibacteriota bacterium]|jgi:transcriptional regulator with XRE-family HTH domain
MRPESAQEVLELGKRIRRERMRQGLSLKEVEKRAGISPTHVSEIERGRSSPTVGALVKIARALERPLTHFVEQGPRPPAVFGTLGDRRTWSVQGGAARFISLLDPASPYDLSLTLVVLAPGARLEERDCRFGVREIFLHGVSGSLTVSLGDTDYEVGAGDSLHCDGEQLTGLAAQVSQATQTYLVTYPRMRL